MQSFIAMAQQIQEKKKQVSVNAGQTQLCSEFRYLNFEPSFEPTLILPFSLEYEIRNKSRA